MSSDNMMNSFDYLIVGQGIAGSLFANQLLKNNHKFMVVDSGLHNASKTSAGMYNSVILKRFTKVDNADEQIIILNKTFSELERKLNVKLNYPYEIYRIFANDDEKKTWQKKLNNASNKEEKIDLDSSFHKLDENQINNPYGTGKVFNTGAIDTNTFLRYFRNYLISKQHLLDECFNYEDLDIYDDKFVYQSVCYKKIVFCEGYGLVNNPYFNYLPIKGDKGEMLTIESEKFNGMQAIKSKAFIMPNFTKNNSYLVGSTYDWDNKDNIPTIKAKNDLTEKLNTFLHCDYKITNHLAAVRPTTIDRKAFLGSHPKHKNMYIFNGLGTRGIMLGCSLSEQMYKITENIDKEDLHREVDIKRFNDCYQQKQSDIKKEI